MIIDFQVKSIKIREIKHIRANFKFKNAAHRVLNLLKLHKTNDIKNLYLNSLS